MKKYKIEVKWALIFILVGLVWMVLEKIAGLHSTYIHLHMYLTNLFAIPAITVYVLALKNKKNVDYDGTMNYKQGFISGLLITIFVTILSPFSQLITSLVITPEYFPNVIEYSLQSGYYETREEAEAFFNLSNYIKQSIIGAFVLGVLTTAITMIFVKSKAKK